MTDPAIQLTNNPNQALWEKGDFTMLAETMRESGAAFVDSLGIRPGMDVLDLGCGDGTTALPAARLGGNVRGVDIARNLVEAGQRRAAAEGLSNITFEWGDATNLLSIADKSFDLVISVFGAMFAPKPLDVARELVRVTRPGGRIVMGNWIPGDPTLVAQILRISAAHTPAPPEGFISPMLWGVENEVIARFGAAGVAPENISFQRDTYTFKAPFGPESFLERFKAFYGPTMNAYAAAEATGRSAELDRELRELFVAQNRGGAERTEIPATFLRVTVSR